MFKMETFSTFNQSFGQKFKLFQRGLLAEACKSPRSRLDVHDLGSPGATLAACQRPLDVGPPDAVATSPGQCELVREMRKSRKDGWRPMPEKMSRKVEGSNPGAGKDFFSRSLSWRLLILSCFGKLHYKCERCLMWFYLVIHVADVPGPNKYLKKNQTFDWKFSFLLSRSNTVKGSLGSWGLRMFQHSRYAQTRP